MRVDFVITELFVGGAERCLTELACGLAERGDEVRAFSLGSLPEGPQALLLEQLQRCGIPVASANSRRNVSLPNCYRQLRRWFGARPCDVCQTFLFHANVLGTHAARAAGIANCVGGLRVAEPNRWRTLLERTAVARMDRLVCVSGAVETFAIEQLRCPAAITQVIPNGVEVERFAASAGYDWSAIGWPDDAIVTLIVGRLHRQKGLELIWRELDRLAPVGSRRKLLFVGAGPLAAAVDRECARLGADRVQRLPWQADVAPLLRAARLLILPSHYEGMPNVVMEAMAAGRPVVCSHVEGVPELLGAESARQSFPPGDHARMAALAEKFLDNNVLSNHVGGLNQQRMRREFTVSAAIDAYRALYGELVSRLEK